MKRILPFLLLAGCNSILGIGNNYTYSGDGGTTDGGVPDATPLDAAPCPSGDLCGQSFTYHSAALSHTTTPDDLSGGTIQAYVPDNTQATGFRVIDGTGTANGTFQIDNVPDGSIYLKFGSNTFYVTDQRSVDVGGQAGGRDDAQVVTQTTNVHFQLGAMQAYHQNDLINDLLVAEAFNVADEYYGLEFVSDAPPAPGATSIDFNVNWLNTYSWEPGGAAELVDSSKGDVFYLTHMQPTWQPDNFGRMQAVERTIDQYSASDVTMTDGTPLTIGGPSINFTPIPQNKTIHFAMNKGAYDAAFPNGLDAAGVWYGSPGVSGNDASIAQWANPFDRPILLGPGEPQVDFDFRGNFNNNTAIDVTYGDPYPASWSRWIMIQYPRTRWYKYPGTIARGLSSAWGGGPGYYRILQPVTPFPAAPDVQAPSNWTVAGVDAYAGGRIDTTGSAAIPMSWTPVGSAQLYRIYLFRLTNSGGRTGFQGAGSISTRDTSVMIPAEMLSGGEWWAFTIQAVKNGNRYSTGVLADNGNAFSAAGESSGRFRLLSSCGNGTVDLGEDCDPNGTSSTASCNVDCTTPACGDGIRNAAAGEACDSVHDSYLCDSDCTVPTCGDGHLNFNTEDCDDGNTTPDGNGCNNVCRATNTCGDGVVQAASEDCDDGNQTDEGNGCSATCHRNIGFCGDGAVQGALETCDDGGDTAGCDGDCTAVQCGDGYWNTAVEQCDMIGAMVCNNNPTQTCTNNAQCGGGTCMLCNGTCNLQ